MTTATVETAQRGCVRAAGRLPTLFALEEQAYQLLAALEAQDEHGVSTTPDDQLHLGLQVELVDQLLREKTESYCSVIRSLEAMADAREVEEHRLRERKTAARKQADWLKNRLLQHMQRTDQARIETARFSVSRRTNRPHVEVLEAALVPSDYQRTRISIDVDKEAILAAYKTTGEIVPGTEITRSERLQIA